MKFIEAKDAANHIGELIAMSAKAYSSGDMGSKVLVNLGAAFPDQLLVVVLRGEVKSKGTNIHGKNVRVQGKLIDYKGKPEIKVTNPLDFLMEVLAGASSRRGG